MAIQKSIKLGKFEQDEHGVLFGTISGLGIGSTDILAEEVKSQDGKSYLKLIADPEGAAYEVGAAFPKLKDGMEYFSVNLDSPLFPAPLSAALFPDRSNTNGYNLVWNRPEASFSPSADIAATNTSTSAGQPTQARRRFFGAKPS